MSAAGGFRVPMKYAAYLPFSAELAGDFTGLASALDSIHAPLSRMASGLCGHRHRNGDWCTFARFHRGTHVTAEGRWIEVKPAVEDGCECPCERCGGWA